MYVVAAQGFYACSKQQTLQVNICEGCLESTQRFGKLYPGYSWPFLQVQAGLSGAECFADQGDVCSGDSASEL